MHTLTWNGTIKVLQLNTYLSISTKVTITLQLQSAQMNMKVHMKIRQWMKSNNTLIAGIYHHLKHVGESFLLQYIIVSQLWRDCAFIFLENRLCILRMMIV